jgi:hypothetical protein
MSLRCANAPKDEVDANLTAPRFLFFALRRAHQGGLAWNGRIRIGPAYFAVESQIAWGIREERAPMAKFRTFLCGMGA